ncbi:MAG: HlyD family efflux transporter periplasmic adaptor subunit [Lachnospiraceae bacterium]|nr:HlyD family efflux transporter periplasmic adaptor subunit [Lachnospiraceae bacterium]
MKKDLTKKKGKGKWIALGIIAVVALLIGYVVFSASRAVKAVKENMDKIQTGTVSTRTLTKSVGATGTIKSIDKEDLSVALANIDISEINVEVGDEVKKGQLLAVFDTSDIEESLADAEESLENAEKQSKLSTNGANRTLSDTKRAADFTIDSAQTSMDNAKESYDDSVKQLQDLKDQNNSNYAAMESELAKSQSLTEEANAQKKAVDKKTKALTEAKTAYTLLVAAMDPAVVAEAEARGWDGEEEADIKAAFDAVSEAEKALNKAAKKLTELSEKAATAAKNYENYYTLCASANAQIQALEKTTKSLKEAYDTSVKAYDNTVANQQSAVATAKDSVTANSITQSTATKTYEKAVETYEEQLKDGKLYSPIDGIVTAVNYEAGDTYQAGALITVQDTSEFIIEAFITEYDIADVKKGQKVLIKTDATGDEQMEGEVTFVSPTAEASMGTTTASYRIKISINNPSDRLRLDMNASLSIIIDQHENAMTVPYNAIAKDDEGKYFVVKMDPTTFETETIYVEAIMESNYYTEIKSDQLKDGDTLQILDKGDMVNIWDLMMGGDVY